MSLLRHGSLAWSIAAMGFVGCGGDDGDSSPMDSGSPEIGVDSTESPAVTISPSDGTKGVLVDTPLILSFSEPMNTASVEAAWTSSSLPAADMVFSWNTTDTILTVDASAVLEYPAGGLTVDTFGYAITLDVSAQDAEGDALAAQVDSLLETARDITVQIPATLPVTDRTGSFDGTVTTTVIRVGDTTTNATWRAFVTFDLTGLPAMIVEWTSASLFARQASITGTPYADLGSITVGSISPIAAIDTTAYSVTAMHVVGFSLSALVGTPDGNRNADVAAATEADHAAGRPESTYRLEFSTAQDLGNDDDYAVFDMPRLDLHFLAW